MAKKVRVFIIGNPEIVEQFKQISFQFFGLIEYVRDETTANAIVDISDYDGTTSLEEEVMSALVGCKKIQKAEKNINKYKKFVKREIGKTKNQIQKAMEVNAVTVLRKPSGADSTLSNFFFDNKEKGVGVEDEKREVKVKGETRIPNDTYNLDLRVSPKFSKTYFRDDDGNLILAKDRISPEQIARFHVPHEMIWVTNVPGFEFILWHWGNTDDDTDGCYIVGSVFGKVKDQDGVLNSRKKYTEIYPILFRSIRDGKKIGKPVTVTYKEAA